MTRQPTIHDIQQYIRDHQADLSCRVPMCSAGCPCRAMCRRFFIPQQLDMERTISQLPRAKKWSWPHRMISRLPGGKRLFVRLLWWRWGGEDNGCSTSNSGLDCFHHMKAYADEDRVMAVYALLTDDLSRQVFCSQLWQRMTFEYLGLASVGYDPAEPQYFIPELCFGPDEVVVDCGAYTGDTLQAYLQHVGEMKRYYLYECDAGLLDALKNTVRNATVTGKLTVRPVGVSDGNKTVSFCAKGNSGSTVVADGSGEPVQVVRLDDDIPERDVTFIKMDIEGSELAALRGAEDIIRTCRPKLAICVYHKAADMLDIPLYLHGICPDYRHFVLRHHYYGIRTETVLYVW